MTKFKFDVEARYTGVVTVEAESLEDAEDAIYSGISGVCRWSDGDTIVELDFDEAFMYVY